MRRREWTRDARNDAETKNDVNENRAGERYQHSPALTVINPVRRAVMAGEHSNGQKTLFDMGEPKRRCRKCKELKNLDAFIADSYHRDRMTCKLRMHRHTICKGCDSKRAMKHKDDNPRKTAVNHRKYFLKRNYKLSQDDYKRMHESQGGRCMICGEKEKSVLSKSGRTKELSVDHDHTTGEVRGLLCHACNVGVGHFRDDPDLMRAAISYVERHREKQSAGK
jgi:hypothetical protein